MLAIGTAVYRCYEMDVRSNVIAPSFGDGQRSKGVGESRVRGGERGRAVGRPNQLIERAIFRSWGIIDSRGAFGGRYQGTSLSSWSSLSSASSKKSRYCKWGVYSYGLKLCRTGSKHGGKVTGPGWNWLNLDLDHADTARTEMTDGRHRHSLTHTLAHTHTLAGYLTVGTPFSLSITRTTANKALAGRHTIPSQAPTRTKRL